MLATGTFAGETASGWQQLVFAAPVAITAGTTYVVSYHTDSGHYAEDGNYFTTQYDSGLLHVPAGGGVFRAGVSGFPAQASQSSNYWVEPILRTVPSADDVAPTLLSVSPAAGTTGVDVNPAITVRFSESLDQATVTSDYLRLMDNHNLLVPETVTYNPQTYTATITPTSALSFGSTYTVVVAGGTLGVRDLAGNPLAQTIGSSFTTAGSPVPDTTPPIVIATNPSDGATSYAIDGSITVTFSEPLNAASVNAASVNVLRNGQLRVTTTATYNPATNSITITPAAPLDYGTNYTVYVIGGSTGVRDLSDNAMASNVSSSFRTVDPPPPTSIWSSATPGNTDVGEGDSLELGVRFTANTDGYIYGVRFYKSAANTGTHSGSLWSSSGQLLATGTFTGESTSGWQTLNFATPVAISAGATYVASYFAPNGHFSVDRSYFNAPLDSGSLHVPATGGVFAYGAKSAFPASSYANSNYWVDVLFSPIPPIDTTPPSVTAMSPGDGATNVSINTAATVTFNEAINPVSLSSSTLQILDGDTLVSATITFDANTNTATVTPMSPLAEGTTYTLRAVGGIPGLKDTSGNNLAQTVTTSFTTVPPDLTPPVVTSINPAGGASEVPISTAIAVTFSEALDAASVNGSTVSLGTAGGASVSATVSYNSATHTVSLVPSVALSKSTTYTVSIAGGNGGVQDAAGNSLAQTITSTFTTVVPDLTPPTVTSMNPASGATNVLADTAVTITFSEALDASTVNSTNISLRTNAGVVVAAAVTYNAASHTVTLTPNTPLSNNAVYRVSVANGVKDAAGNALATSVTTSFTTIAAPVPSAAMSSLWSDSTTPSTADVGEPQSLELGIKFTANADGFIRGVRFYKSSSNTGSHIGNLWSSSGQLLATGTFTGESASGWQTLDFASPVAVAAGTTYIASYYAPNGHFAVNRSYFGGQFTSSQLSVPANGGVFKYGNTTAFPNSSFQSSNYWVDVMYSVATMPPAPDTTPPTVASVNPANKAGDVATTTSITVAFSEALDAASVNNGTVRLLDGGTQINASLAYNSSSNTVTLTPNTALAHNRTYTLSISGVTDTAGNTLASTFNSTFTTDVGDIVPPTVTSISPANGSRRRVDQSGRHHHVQRGTQCGDRQLDEYFAANRRWSRRARHGHV